MTAARAAAQAARAPRRRPGRLAASPARRPGDGARRGPLPSRPGGRRRLLVALRGVPLAALALGIAEVAGGHFARPALRPLEWVSLALLSVAAAFAAARMVRRSGEGRSARPAEQLELGALATVGAAALAQLSADGASEGPLFPVVYLAAAVAVAFLSRGVGLALVGLAAALQAAAWWLRGAPTAEVPGLCARVGFIVLFALLYHAVLWARLVAARRAEREAVERRLREIDERARELRLLAPGAHGPADDAERARERGRAAVVEVEAAFRGALEVAEVALASHTCALFLLSPDDRELLLRECRSRSDCVSRRPIPAREGVLGGVVSRAVPVRLRGDIRSVTYYEDGTRPRALAAVPLVDRRGGHVRGVIVADRLDDQPFSDADEELLTRIAGELIRAVASERILVDLARTRDEKERFYAAIERLNRTSKPREVFDAALEAAQDFAPVDFGAVTLVVEEDGRRHEVVRAAAISGAERRPSELEGLRFSDNPGLVSAAVRLGSALPGTEIRVADATVLDESTRLRGLASIKILPLKTGDRVLGTLLLGSRREGAFGPDAVRQLEVIAMQAADALLRARLFEQTERLATTDGLTGLANHRTFQARLEEQVALARRYGKRLSVVLCDVDHFKSVNDTYGHPVGDQVLQGTARVLLKEARATDLVARYGGEEFALVMPEADATGAAVIAERIRVRLRETPFPTELGPLRVSISLGVATFPDDARTKGRLVEVADACLYHAKRHGRDRTVAAAELGARPATG
ncbi:MAG TPA: diguanylate cyclase [Anaeromyxobacteraceae bacterium]|nr:diguanylate cyclase [Anaeromyxobacteraceae bacterium]